MKFAAIGCALMAGIILLMGGCTAFYGLNVCNREVALKNQVQAQSNVNQASLDAMWKIIQQKCQITGKWSGDQKEIYKDIINGRVGGALLKTVQEANPSLDIKLFQSTMNSVEAERKRFLRDQVQLMDYIRERKTLIESPLSGLVLRIFGDTTAFKPKPTDGWSEDYQYTWVTSESTQGMVNKGQENDTKLDFGDKPAAKK